MFTFPFSTVFQILSIPILLFLYIPCSSDVVLSLQLGLEVTLIL
jgi:hypothetical protein